MTKQRERLDIRTNREYMTVDTLLHGFKKRGISYKKTPDGYSKEAASQFIELTLCGFPTPLIIFQELRDGSLVVRLGDILIEVLRDFFEDKFPLESLELLSGLNGKTFSELPPLRRSLFEDYKLHVISVQPPTPNDVLEHFVEQTSSNLGGLYRPLKSITGSL